MRFLSLFASLLLVFHLSLAKNFHLERNLFAAKDLNGDIDDLIDLVPKTQIEEVVKRWTQTDPEVKKNIDYATSEGFKKRVRKLENSKEFKTIQSQLEGINLNLPHFADIIHYYIGLQPMSSNSSPNRQKRSSSGLRGLLDEIRPIVPMPKITLNIASKYVSSQNFRTFARTLANQDFKNNMATLFDSEVVTEFIKDAENNGVDMQALYDFVGSLSPIYKAVIH